MNLKDLEFQTRSFFYVIRQREITFEAHLTNQVKMKIGVPKEIKSNENRVAATPAGVMEFIKKGHEVVIQSLSLIHI